MSNAQEKEGGGFFGWIERVGNKLPHPVILFVILSLIVIIVSYFLALANVSVTYFDAREGTELTVEAVSLLSRDGINHIFNSAVSNFTNFAPLGTVIVTMLGVGVAEWTGLISASMKRLLTNVPTWLLSSAVVFAGIMSNIASDVGYVVIIPLGAIIFAAAGRHPIAGLTIAFAGVSGGFSANLIPGPTDALLTGISNSSLEAMGIDQQLQITDNWYFIIGMTVLFTIIGSLINDKYVEPSLGKYTGDYMPSDEPLTDLERKGLKRALLVFLIYIAIMGFLMFGPNALFKTLDEATGDLNLNTFLSSGLLFGLFLMFLLPGVAYGVTVGKIKDSNDFVEGMTDGMRSMASFIVLAFFAAQLIDYFNYSNIGTILASSGAHFLESIGLIGIPLLIAFILLSAFINLFIGSASAKWSILSPIFTPMFNELGIPPQTTLISYRIADSATNIISPLMNYFPMVIVFMNRYDKKAGVGTLISIMMVYSMAFLIGGSLLFVVWYLLGIPLGPGAPIR